MEAPAAGDPLQLALPAILGIDPRTGAVTHLGSLPVAIGGASAVTHGDAALVLGGARASGQANPAIYRVTIVAPKTAARGG